MEPQEIDRTLELTAAMAVMFTNKDLDVVLASLAFCVAVSSQMMEMDIEEFLKRFSDDVRRIRAEVLDKGTVQ